MRLNDCLICINNEKGTICTYVIKDDHEDSICPNFQLDWIKKVKNNTKLNRYSIGTIHPTKNHYFSQSFVDKLFDGD